LNQAMLEGEQGLEIVSGLEQDESVLRDEADLYNLLGTVYFDQGNYSQAAEVYERSTELRRQAGDLPGLARSYNNQARLAWARDDLAAASQDMQRMLEISQQIGNNYFLAFGYNNLGAVSYKMGDLQQALNYYHTALALQRRIGDSFGVAQSYSNIGEACYTLGEFFQARRYLERAANAFEAIRSEAELSEVYRLLAEVELASDQVVRALEYAQLARDIAAAAGNPEWQGIAERVLAQGQVRAGQFDLAQEAFEASLASLLVAENRQELAKSYHAYGLLLAEWSDKKGQQALARIYLTRALELYAALGDEKQAREVRAELMNWDTGLA
jgi:tetratricopeptide (TPR) repeat protein